MSRANERVTAMQCVRAARMMRAMVELFGVAGVLRALDDALHAEAHSCPGDCGRGAARADHLNQRLLIMRKK